MAKSNNSTEKTKHKALSPQAVVSKFWGKFNSKAPGKVTSVFPRSLHKSLLADADSSSPKSRNAAQSYQAAAKECRARVRAIVRECERTNSKFSDPEFDIESDFNGGAYNCLFGLLNGLDLHEDDEGDDDKDYGVSEQRTSSQESKSPLNILESSHISSGDRDASFSGCRYVPGSVHRIPWIFENPQFTIGGFSGSDVKQGRLGDCWWVAAVATIAHRQDLMKKICVARDEECGVYGFVFCRDGEWISTVVDDNLFLKEGDYGRSGETYDPTGKKGRRHRKENQMGSEALAFAKCEDPNGTWFPLLEKAFAKVYGDYEALSGGWASLAVEDLTGGVSTTMAADSVLRKERLWRELLVCDTEDAEFVFSAGVIRPWGHSSNGIVTQHDYSVLKATEVEDEKGNKIRLVKIRNPWGAERTKVNEGAWLGPWSDGSKEWTPYMVQKLRYQPGDDGAWWMSYNDMLEHFASVDRVRLFDERWTVAQQWASVSVPWLAGYLKKKFIVEVKEEGTVVIALSQLDDRYFQGLIGQYRFSLQFLLRSPDDPRPICQVRAGRLTGPRSINCEVELEPGIYEVIPKIVARQREGGPTVQKVVKIAADKKAPKLRQIGLQHDLAHAKGGITDEDEAIRKKRKQDRKKRREMNLKKEKEQKEQKDKDDARKKMEEEMMLRKTEYYRSMSKTKGVESNGDATLEKAGSRPEEVPLPPSATPAPGCWPADIFKSPLEIEVTPEAPTESEKESWEEVDDKKQGKTRSPSQGSICPPMERSSTSQSTVSKPVPTPPTEAQSEDEVNGSDGPDTESECESESDDDGSEPGSNDSSVRKQRKKEPWNAVCVIGLRVYAQHAGISVQLADSDAPRVRSAKGGLTKPTSEAGPLCECAELGKNRAGWWREKPSGHGQVVA